MADIYLNSKPEAESFTYAYVENEEGKVVKITVDNMKMLLGVGYIDGEITISSTGWTVSDDGTYYTQVIAVPNASTNSRVDLNPSPTQIIQLMNEEVSMFISNDNGTFTAYAINNKPSIDMTISVRISEA